MKALLIADIHIDTKGFTFETNRLSLLADEINKQDIDEVWIIGDLIDKSKPTVHDITTAHNFLRNIKYPIKYIDGNHERENKQSYILEPLMTMWGYEKLPLVQTINGHKITAVGHSELDELHGIDGGSLLLSHFRWSHKLYGKGELHSIERELSQKFTNIILGDIHYKYSPIKNVRYISQPYANRYSTTQEGAMVLIEIKKSRITQQYIDLDLPTKVKLTTPLRKLSKLIETLDDRHKYVIDVKIVDEKELKTFNRISLPKNVHQLRPVLAKVTKHKEQKVAVKDTILDTLMDVLPKSLSNDTDYIKEILEN